MSRQRGNECAKAQELRPSPRRQPRPFRGPAPSPPPPLYPHPPPSHPPPAPATGRLPPLPGRTPWERRLSRFSSFRASRASWATRSSAVAGPPGLGSAAKRTVSRNAASVPDPGSPASESSTSGATRVLSVLRGHCRATGDPPPRSPSSSPRLHPSHRTPISGRPPPPGPLATATSPCPVPQSRQVRPRVGTWACPPGHFLSGSPGGSETPALDECPEPLSTSAK